MKNNQRQGNLILFVEEKVDEKFAQDIARQLNLEIVREASELDSTDLVLRVAHDGITLEQDGMIVRGDFSKMLPRLGPAKLKHELIAKAAKLNGKIENPTAIDATAGLGDDAIILAALGFQVTLFEYNPVVALLLEDAIKRAAKIPELHEIVGRMKVIQGNSIDKLKELEQEVDLIMIDPMFPERQKSALIKKKFQLIQQLEQPCLEEEALVQAAIKANPRKIIIKRPSKAPELGGVKASHVIKSKVIRYDCILLPRYH